MFSHLRIWVIGLPLFFALSLPAYSERVGFTFEGALLGGSDDVTLFGIQVPGDSPVSGTFAYDTNVTGIDGLEVGSRDFPQEISGGFSLRVGNAIDLSASEYFIEVTNDFDDEEGEILDVFSVQFARYVNTAATPVLLLNGEPYSGKAFMQVTFSWPSETFDDPMEPQLTKDRPALYEEYRASLGFVGEMGGQVFVAPIVTAVTQLAGDYNRNGLVDADDYTDWKSAFGATGSNLPDDGNLNQIVDAADYTVWRDNLGMFATIDSGFNSGIPEPTSLALAAFAATLIFVRRRDRQ